MATGQSTKLTGAVGEFLVAAELCRRDLLATPFAGNVPHYDIIASGIKGGHILVQVKAINEGTWQFDISKYLDVRMHEDGKRQVLGKLQPEPFPGLVCVLVLLKGTGKDRFFVLEWKELRKILAAGYRKYLLRHNFVRPSAHRSFHTALKIADVDQFENRWDKILPR